MSRPNFPQIEKEILAFWEKNNIFQKSIEKDSPKGSFVFFEGPPTANGHPGIHHAEARVFKDCIPRFRTMQGYRVDRKGGWDTHGLPVELQVEKELGFTGKKDIENFGVQAFNEKCKESVWKYLSEWQVFTKQIGYWVDLEHAYVTYHPEYIESLWWIIKQIFDKGLLYQDYRVTPHCPRCESSLSSHELAQGYKEIEDLSVIAKFIVKDGSHEALRSDVRTVLLAWTTTPWTLPGNVALAVGSELTYVVIEKNDDSTQEGRVRFVLAKELLTQIFPDHVYEVITELKGSEIVGTKYEPLYPFMGELVLEENREKLETSAYRVYPADFVTTVDGTGIVHTAVMYGSDDFDLGQKIGLPKHHLVKFDGTFVEGMDFLSGRFVADEEVAIDIIKDLAHRGLLFAKAKYKHTYPFCWRCKTKVIYYAKDSWYIRMSSLREKLLKENEKIHWEPEHIKEGRFGEWIREVKDWAFSRERYWGTPLPIWVCENCGGRQCIGSFEELRSASLKDLPEQIDPHRPFVDEVKLKCQKCGGTTNRVSDVCDVWFDSGAMPFAQWHYPFENKEKIDTGEGYPADYISEAIDQTRGWFYTLLAVATLLEKERPFKHVVCLGHVLDTKGKKMSKSLGNIIDPFAMMEKYGADAVRWYMYTINQPGESKRFDEKALDDMVKKVFLILWNVYTFYEMFAGSSVSNTLRSPISTLRPTHLLDRWILSRLHSLVKQTTDDLESYKIIEPARAIAEFINDLSTWYLRRSRDRFKGEDEQDKQLALNTLRECLLSTVQLMAPFTPFLSEHLYLKLGGQNESVHLEAWPLYKEEFLDGVLIERMGKTRSIISRLLERRLEVGIPVRQVLSQAKIFLPKENSLLEKTSDQEAFIDLIKDEANIKEIVLECGDDYKVELDINLTPELIREGTIRELTRRINTMRKDAGLTIEDRIELFLQTDEEEVKIALEEHRQTFLNGVLATTLRMEGEAPDGSQAMRTNDFDLIIGIEKK